MQVNSFDNLDLYLNFLLHVLKILALLVLKIVSLEDCGRRFAKNLVKKWKLNVFGML